MDISEWHIVWNIHQETCCLCQWSHLNLTSLVMFVPRFAKSPFVTSVAWSWKHAHTQYIRLCAKQTPLSLEINTSRSKLKDFVEKIVKAKLGMNLPLIMCASNLLYEAGDVEDDMIAIYEANLEKVYLLSLVWNIYDRDCFKACFLSLSGPGWTSFSSNWWNNAYGGGYATGICLQY